MRTSSFAHLLGIPKKFRADKAKPVPEAGKAPRAMPDWMRVALLGPAKAAKAVKATLPKLRPRTQAPASPAKPFAALLADERPPIDVEAIRREAFARGVEAGRAEIRARLDAFLPVGRETGQQVFAAISAVHGSGTVDSFRKWAAVDAQSAAVDLRRTFYEGG